MTIIICTQLLIKSRIYQMHESGGALTLSSIKCNSARLSAARIASQCLSAYTAATRRPTEVKQTNDCGALSSAHI